VGGFPAMVIIGFYPTKKNTIVATAMLQGPIKHIHLYGNKLLGIIVS
jgi:hypothetical protein